MGIKEVVNQERKDLKSVKRPYETVAFTIFAVLFFQQVFFIFKNFLDYLNNNWFNTANIANANLQGFVARIITMNNTKLIFIAVGILAWMFYYFAVYILVWNYARKHSLAKWTWTLFVVFGPTIFLAPSYIWFVIYAYRKYLVRFAKRVVLEFKEFNTEHKFPEEKEV